uniref:Tryptophan 2,3-dioxygenase n=1 Tax=Rhabditophanes sp. KR3021 TaxID=114890 RepID=A0AC35UCL0_9BILA
MNGGGCPFGYGAPPPSARRPSVVFSAGDCDMEHAQEGVNKIVLDENALTYGKYLQLDRLLDCQLLRSEQAGETVHDEHLFIIIHQTYELWFKQMIFDLDKIRSLLNCKIVDETKTLSIVNGLERIVRIFKLLVDQMLILESMSPLDFVEFRSYLTTSSGFQSLQFRLLENKIGVDSTNRVKYNSEHYKDAFKNQKDKAAAEASETEPSLFVLVERWLSRVPGLHPSEDEPGFWKQYNTAVESYLAQQKKDAEHFPVGSSQYESGMMDWERAKVTYDSILKKEMHDNFVKKKERRFCHDAMKGALMIYFHRDMPRFSQPYQILVYLMDIDSLFTKWRYNHVLTVQRMLGNKTSGTGGSSGYLYLRSTVSDRYKVFLDLFNLSTWLLPRCYIPKPTKKLFEVLSQHNNSYINLNDKL